LTYQLKLSSLDEPKIEFLFLVL